MILHQSPPPHGAAKVGDFIANSRKLNDAFECRFIRIRSAETIEDIGRVSIKKICLAVSLFFRVLVMLVLFRPQKIYFTASVSGIAFYRDLLLSILWRSYSVIFGAEVFYHYHTKGIDNFVSKSKLNLILTRFFLQNVNVILLSRLLKKDFDNANVYKNVFFLPNGITNNINEADLDQHLIRKYEDPRKIQILYLSQMTKEKGYQEVLSLAKHTLGRSIHYHFAGAWQTSKDKDLFFEFIDKNNLSDSVTYHGFVEGTTKENLYRMAHVLAYPSHNDAFPLTILESLSYGVPVIASRQGSIPIMLDEKTGLVVSDLKDYVREFDSSLTSFISQQTAQYCRERFVKEFTLKKFESCLIRIFNE